MDGLGHWEYAETFTARQAAYLIMGIDPASGDATDVHSAKHIIDRMDGAYDSAHASYSFDPAGWYCDDPDKNRELIRGELKSVQMEKLLKACHSNGEEKALANWLFSDASAFNRQQFSRAEIHRWITQNNLPSKFKFLNQSDAHPVGSERSISTRERNTLLKLVIGMAVMGYRYNPAASKSNAPKEIADDLVSLGIDVSDDTVRKYLKEAANTLLPTGGCGE